MSKKIAIMADSTCELPNHIIEKYHIKLMPLRVIYKDREYRDGIDITPEHVYAHLHEEIPTTSLPIAEDVLYLFDELVDDGYTDVIVITLTSVLSGTYQLATLLGKAYRGLEVEVVDSKALSMIYGFMVLEGARYAHTGNKALILEKIMYIRNCVKSCYMIDTYACLKKSGRVGKFQGTLADLLKIKLIVSMGREGNLETYTMVRGRERAMRTMTHLLRRQFSHKTYKLAIVNGNAEKDAKAMYEGIKDIGTVNELFMTKLSAVTCVHTGPGIIGYVAYEIKNRFQVNS